MDIRGRKMKKPPACVQCRKRKIGCDRVKPICGNCMKSGKGDCFYPDVPGQFTQSSTPSSTGNLAGNMVASTIMTNNIGSSVSYYHPVVHRSKETTQMIQQNPELASMEQIREYNTRLQLMNAQERRATPEAAKYIPRTSTAKVLGNKPVSSANGEDLNLNWVQGPAIFDLINTNYKEDDLLSRELKFIKLRMVELQELTGKKIEMDFSFIDKRHNEDLDDENEDIIESGNQSKKKIKLSSKSDPASSISDDLNEFDDEYLDGNNVLTILNYIENDTSNILMTNNTCKIDDMPNCILDDKFLIKRDRYLEQFYKKLNVIITEHFIENVTQWNQKNYKKSNIIKTQKMLKFPSRVFIKDVIDRYSTIFNFSKDNNNKHIDIIPIVKPDKLSEVIDKLFGRDPEFSTESLNIETLSTIGQISICMLLVYESLSNILSKPLGDIANSMLIQLSEWAAIIKTNVYIIRTILNKRFATPTSLDALHFTALWKYYEALSNDTVNEIDGDEDVHMARKLAINYETKDSNSTHLWNFIFRNYCWRHLIKGELPALVLGEEFNTSIILGPLLVDEIKLLTMECDLVKYLHTKGDIVSIKRIEKMKSEMKNYQNDRTEHTGSNTINWIIQSLIYRNSVVRLDYLLLLQYDQIKDFKKVASTYSDLLIMFKETLLFIFSSLTNNNITGLEFLLTKLAYSLLDGISNIILSLYQRCFYSFNLQTTNLQGISEPIKNEINEQCKGLASIIGKLKTILQEDMNKAKKINPLLKRTFVKLTTMFDYIKLCEQESVAQILVNKHIMFGGNSFFDNLKLSDLTDKSKSINEISELLISSDKFDESKSYSTNNLLTLGITQETFQDVYSSFFS